MLAKVGVACGFAIGAMFAALGSLWAFGWLAYLLSQWVLPVSSVTGSIGPTFEAAAGVVGVCAVVTSLGALAGRAWARPLALPTSIGLIVVAVGTVARTQYIFTVVLAISAAGFWALRRRPVAVLAHSRRRLWLEPLLIGVAMAEIVTVLLSPVGVLGISLGVATGQPGPRPSYALLALAMLWLATMAALQVRVANAMAMSSGIVVPVILLSETIAAGALLPWLHLSIRVALVAAAVLIAMAVLLGERRHAGP